MGSGGRKYLLTLQIFYQYFRQVKFRNTRKVLYPNILGLISLQEVNRIQDGEREGSDSK